MADNEVLSLTFNVGEPDDVNAIPGSALPGQSLPGAVPETAITEPMSATLLGRGVLHGIMPVGLSAGLLGRGILHAQLRSGVMEAALLVRGILDADLTPSMSATLFGRGILAYEGAKLEAVLIGTGLLWDSYTGPGTGLQPVGGQPLPLPAMLHEGDTFHLDRPFGGLHGESGLARVLSLSLDDDLQGEWQIQMIPHTDGAFATILDELGRPRYTVDLSGNLFRQVRELQRRR